MDKGGLWMMWERACFRKGIGLHIIRVFCISLDILLCFPHVAGVLVASPAQAVGVDFAVAPKTASSPV